MRVGTSLYFGIFITSHKDHPHACGDKLLPVMLVNIWLGSSPCVWGQEDSVCVKVGDTGIIPMRVGTRMTPGTAEF